MGSGGASASAAGEEAAGAVARGGASPRMGGCSAAEDVRVSSGEEGCMPRMLFRPRKIHCDERLRIVWARPGLSWGGLALPSSGGEWKMGLQSERGLVPSC